MKDYEYPPPLPKSFMVSPPLIPSDLVASPLESTWQISLAQTQPSLGPSSLSSTSSTSLLPTTQANLFLGFQSKNRGQCVETLLHIQESSKLMIEFNHSKVAMARDGRKHYDSFLWQIVDIDSRFFCSWFSLEEKMINILSNGP